MLLTAIWPIFALIVMGFVLSRRGFPSSEFWPAAERMNYFVLFPALLVSSLASAPLGDPGLFRLGAAGVVSILLASAALWAVRWARPMPAARFGPVLQGAVRFNTYLALSVLTVLAGPTGVQRAAIYLAVAVPLVNVLSILALSERGVSGGAVGVLATVLRNPLILACVAGFALAASGIGLPFGIGDLFRLLGQGSLPLGLLCVGAALRPGTLRPDLPGLAGTTVLRLLAMPLLAMATARAFGLPPAETLTLVVFSAVPTAPTAYVLTRQMNGDGPFMAGIVTLQTMAAAASLPLVLWLAGG